MSAMVRLIVWLAAVAGATVWSWSGVAWSASADPEVQVMGVVRAVAAVLAGYLLVVTLLALLGAMVRVPALGAVAPGVVRRIVAGAIAGGLLVAPGVAAADTSPGTPTTEHVDAPVLRRVEEPARDLDLPAPAAPAVARRDAVTVEAGDHLWKLAEEELAARLARAPTDAEVIPYWRALIDANRHVVGANPNLVLPGQQIDLPS